MPTAAGTAFELLTEGPIADFGGVLKDGVYYATRRVSYQQDTWNIVEGYDLDTGEKVYSQMPTSNTVLSSGFDVDPLTGNIYGICYTENLQGFTISTIDYTSVGVQTTKVADLEGNWTAFAINSKGEFYGIKTTWVLNNGIEIAQQSVLCTIDRTTGQYTEVGNTGYAAQYTSAITFDKKSDRLFYYVTPLYGKSKLTEINVKTGAATLISEFDNEIQMAVLYVPGLTAPAKAPGEPTDIRFSFPDGSYSGTVTFKAPATLADGSAATGDVTVHIELNGYEKGSATGAYGQELSIPLSMGTPGPKTFVLYATNDAGTGPKVTVRNVYIGPDTPVSPTVTLEYADGIMKLSWLPVSSGVNGGSISPDNVTYDIIRYPDMKTVATGLSGTTFSETVAEPETGVLTYSYEVIAFNGELESQPAASNKVVIGSLIPPFKDFSADVEYPTLQGYTVIDANNDGYTWKVWQGTATISYNADDKTVGGDDWMMLPPLRLKKGEAYELSFDAYGEQDYLTERLEVKMGTSAAPAAMTTEIIPVSDINCTASSKRHFSKMLVPEADGRYFIGFHGLSAPDMYELHIVNLAVTGATLASALGEVTDFSVAASTDGALKANVSFKAPSSTWTGRHSTKSPALT